MPVSRPTASCIWNSFRSSGKRHLFLTGSRGSGKTTLLASLFPQALPGLTTWAVPKQAVCLRENLTGRTVAVGVFRGSLPGPGNQMVPLAEGFLSLGVPALRRCMEAASPWVTLDEIGYLEAQCGPYQDALAALLETKQVAAVVRKQALPALTALLAREDAFVVDLDDPYGDIGCVILASGLGRRFGGNKLLADFHGQPVICRILDATEGIFSRRVVVTRHQAVARLCEDRAVPALLHALPHRSDSVRLGLDRVSGAARCLFAVSDQPLLRRDTVAALALASANAPEAIWWTRCGAVHGSPVVFPQWTFPQLRALTGEQGGSHVLRQHPQCLRTVAVDDPYELADIDTPADLEKLLKL